MALYQQTNTLYKSRMFKYLFVALVSCSVASAQTDIESVTIDGGAMTGVTTLAMGGTLTGVTSLGMSGVLTGVTTLAASSTVTLTNENAITLSRGGTSKIQKTNSGNLQIASVANVKVESVTFNGGAVTGVTTLGMSGVLTGVTTLSASNTVTLTNQNAITLSRGGNQNIAKTAVETGNIIRGKCEG